MRDFNAELKERIRKINEIDSQIIIEASISLYNIHKRSLPIGNDRLVFAGLTKYEAETLLEKFLKAKLIDYNGETKLIYYDLIKSDATLEMKSVFYNEKLEII